MDIARWMAVDRSSVTRDIPESSLSRPIIEEDDRQARFDRAGYMTAIHLTMLELEASHLATRLLARVMEFPFPHASAALRKLAEAEGRDVEVIELQSLGKTHWGDFLRSAALYADRPTGKTDVQRFGSIPIRISEIAFGLLRRLQHVGRRIQSGMDI